jgi:hypothetical protein
LISGVRWRASRSRVRDTMPQRDNLAGPVKSSPAGLKRDDTARLRGKELQQLRAGQHPAAHHLAARIRTIPEPGLSLQTIILPATEVLKPTRVNGSICLATDNKLCRCKLAKMRIGNLFAGSEPEMRNPGIPVDRIARRHHT